MPSTQSTASGKHTVTENVRRELSKIAPGATVWIRTDKQNLWDKKVSLSQNKICKSRNGESGNGMGGMMKMRGTRVGMMGMGGIWVRLRRIWVGMRGI